QVGTASDGSYTFGPAGLDAGLFNNAWPIVQYRNFSVSGSTLAGFVGPVYAGPIDKCLDNFQGSATNGNKIELFSCNYTDAQRWQVQSDGTMRTFQGKCMEIANSGTVNGSLIQINDCTGSANQIWQPVHGTLVNPGTGKCLDDPGSSTTDRTQLDIMTCDGSIGQYWTIPQ
ncbi:MAG TPA: RICIN domain-containing protein, partial [Candidatus Saccharimonadales bacterium]|nr:RICIN domain-containing protein [Candidatus Saccharimonadales bacterium]